MSVCVYTRDGVCGCGCVTMASYTSHPCWQEVTCVGGPAAKAEATKDRRLQSDLTDRREAVTERVSELNRR